MIRAPIRAVCAVLTLAWAVMAQQGGYISGVVRDRSSAVVPGVEVRVQSQETGARQKVYSDASGYYSTSELAAGSYKITVRNGGFRTITRTDVTVRAGKTILADFSIDLLPVQGEITVTASQSDDNPTAAGLTASRDSAVAGLPANGHDVHALFSLLPGATVTPASVGSGGQFTVGGQRPNSNSFRVNDVSANVGIGIISVPGAFPGGTLPGMTTIGGMQSLASNEETDRVELRSADFAAQYGDRPGAQVDIETRSGTNEFHGSFFGYIRPHFLSSTDFFARGAAADLPTAALNGWGGSVGGPVRRNHTWFFASFERTDVHDSALQVIAVPSDAARLGLGDAYQNLLDAFPAPAGRALNALEAVGFSPLLKAAAVTKGGLRMDHSMGNHVQLFARYATVPSSATSIELGTAYSSFHWQTATGGVNIASGNVVQQLRYNFSQAIAQAEHGPYDTPALNAINQSLSSIFQNTNSTTILAGTNLVEYFSGGLPSRVTQVSIAGVGQTVAGQEGKSGQQQQALVYNLAKDAGKHYIRFGGDYTRLTPNNSSTEEIALASPGISQLLAGVPLGLTYSDFTGPIQKIEKGSLFGQDTIHVTDNFNMLVGLRWEVTPPTSAAFGGQAPNSYPYVGYWRGTGTEPVSISSVNAPGSHWPMRYDQIAPRVGIAYHLRSPNLTIRAGGGLFYDTQMGSIISNENPLTAWQYLPASSNPAPVRQAIGATPEPILFLPRVWEWRTSIEKTLNESSMISVTYVGSAGRRLLRNQATENLHSGILQSLAFTSNSTSDYEALVAQFSTNVSRSLNLNANYTWAHSIDTGSSDTTPQLMQQGTDRGSSSFDIRHNFTASLTWRLFAGWTLGATFLARSGFPFDVTTVDRSIGFGFDNEGRANIVPGVPVWINGQLNGAAFQAPASGVNGSLGRNALSGYGLFQVDASLRRAFHLYRGLSGEFSASAFNLLNHPSFSNPVSYLGSALFGQSTSTANLMLGSGSPTTGLTPLYQAGGPRTIELGWRFRF